MPAIEKLVVEADFVIPMPGVWVAGMVTVLDVLVTLSPTGGVAVAVAVLVSLPASTSAWEVV